MSKPNDKYLAILVVLIVASIAVFSQYYGTTGASGSKLSVLPELEIVDVEATNTEITTTIQNIGQGTKHRFAVNFYEREKGSDEEGELVARQFFKNGLNSKDPETFTVEWESNLPRNGELVVKLDPENYVREVNEDNNEWNDSFVSGIINPDLYVSYLDVIDSKILFRISNTGSNFEKAFVTNVYMIGEENNLLKSYTIDSFEESETFSIPFAEPEKPYTVRVIVDDLFEVDGIKIDRSQIAESNEDNNVLDLIVE
jgi:subtilase family serine protease